MKTSVSNQKNKAPLFQVMLLDNDASLDVKVQEAEQVNFFQVKEHLKKGGSVFITSKDSQKLLYPSAKAQRNYTNSRRTYGVLFHRN